MKYGFVLAGGSPDDNIDFPNADSANTLSGDRLQAFLKAEHGGEEWEATLGTRLHIVLNSLPIFPQNVTVAEEIAYVHPKAAAPWNTSSRILVLGVKYTRACLCSTCVLGRYFPQLM